MLLAIGYWLLAIACCLLLVIYWLFVIRYLMNKTNK